MREIQVAECFQLLYQKSRYKNLYGGRGGGKSHAVAEYLILRALTEPILVMCGREYQNSINDSVHKLLVNKIEQHNLGDYYEIKKNTIESVNGSQFIFKGLANGIQGIKSIEGVDVFWGEEAQTFSQNSLDILIPTIRKPGSELIFTWNPEYEDDPIYKLLVTNKPKNCLSAFITYRDNPWFPDVLEQEREDCLRTDPDKHAWVWEGQFKTVSAAQILWHKVRVDNVSPTPEESLLHGMDFGFSVDPNAFARCWQRFNDDGTKDLCIDYCFMKKQIPFDAYKPWISHVPGFSEKEIFLNGGTPVIQGDSARPETIAHIANMDIDIVGVPKWSGSVEDGIDWIKSHDRILIHPRCVDLITEARHYSYVVDKKTLMPTTKIEDKHNHGWDAIRYACVELIQQSQLTGTIYDEDHNG